jgi:hypothetical protein
VWNGTKGKFVVPFNMTATSSDIEEEGMTLMYIATINNYSDWKCEYNAPSLHWNPKFIFIYFRVYGGVQ